MKQYCLIRYHDNEFPKICYAPDPYIYGTYEDIDFEQKDLSRLYNKDGYTYKIHEVKSFDEINKPLNTSENNVTKLVDSAFAKLNAEEIQALTIYFRDFYEI